MPNVVIAGGGLTGLSVAFRLKQLSPDVSVAVLEPQSGDEPDDEVESVVVEVPADVTERLQQVARRHRITVGSVVHAAWSLLLSRYGGGQDVVFGTTAVLCILGRRLRWMPRVRQRYLAHRSAGMLGRQARPSSVQRDKP